MNRIEQMLCASAGVFAGSLLADVVFGNGIQTEDLYEAALVALVAASLQWWLTRTRLR